MEIPSWNDVASQAKNDGVPSSLINWLHAVYDPASPLSKHWRRTKQYGTWESTFKRTSTFQNHLNSPIKRSHLKAGKDIPVYVESFFEYDYFPIVRNIVATCKWIPLADLSRIAHFIPNVELMSEYSSAINLRIGKVMCRLFTTGMDFKLLSFPLFLF